MCAGCEGRVERGGERRHAITCLASVRARAGAVHRLVLTFADRGGAAWMWRLGCAGVCRATLLSTLASKYREGGCDVCAGCEGRVERGGERRHALTCLRSVRARAGAVHRLVLTFAADRVGAAWVWRLGCAGTCRATLMSTLGRKYREGGCDVCAGCEGRVERGGERRHALTWFASVRACAGAVHRLVLTFASVYVRAVDVHRLVRTWISLNYICEPIGCPLHPIHLALRRIA